MRKHGGRAAFAQPFCQDPICEAARQRQRMLSKRKRVYGTGVYVDAEPARRHVLSLLANGMTRPQIAAAASLTGTKVDRTQIRNLVVGQPPHQGPATRLRPETAKALLTVQLTYGPVTDSGWVDATGTRRRIEALNVIGYHDTPLALEIGMSPANFASFRRRSRITAASALAIAKVYDRLKDTEGPAMHAKGNFPKFVRSCQRKGYLAPIWWDDDNIDDPTYDPTRLDDESVDEVVVLRVANGERLPMTPGERRQVVRMLHREGLGDQAIEQRTGMAARTALRIRQELGLPSTYEFTKQKETAA